MSEKDEEQGAGEEDAGGDPACWAEFVCPECGAFVAPEAPGRAGTAGAACPRCGAPR